MLSLASSHANAWLTFRFRHNRGDRKQSRGKEVKKMREYEVIVVIHPEQDETSSNELIERISGWITDGGGTIQKIDPWGKRKLAYEIRKQREGQYYLINTQMPPSFVTELGRNIRYLEPVIRSMVTAVEE
jgi:small subunit ribosomal protein S6